MPISYLRSEVTMKKRGTVLWVDDRTKHFEGQIIGTDGQKYYFNWSTWLDKYSPVRGQCVKFIEDHTKPLCCLSVSDLLGALNGGSK